MPSQTKTCQNCQTNFTIESEDFEFYQKIQVPPPTFCPECRMKRRMVWRNENKLYKRKCDFSGEEIFSCFRKDSLTTVYDNKIWWSDDWDDLKSGQDYDFEKSFFEQFGTLLKTAPQPAR